MSNPTTPRDDIVEILRALARHEHDDLSIGEQAADYIERLRERAAAYKGQVEAAELKIDRATRLIRTLCNAAPESPGCLYSRCDCNG
jgi:hypothetical protein